MSNSPALRQPPEEATNAVRPGFCLPAYFYEDEARFDLDQQVMRENTWFLAGHVSQIPAHGDYFLFDFARESIIIMRSRDGSVNAFYNVCRHRGSRICNDHQGQMKLLTCPYHAWTYDTDGRLIGSPSMPPSFQKEQGGLIRCHIGLCEGLIFVNLAQGEPPAFESFVSRIRPFIANYQLSGAKLIAGETLSCPANWKLVVENFAECYHCLNAHKELVRTHDVKTIELYNSESAEAKAWLERIRRLGFPTAPLMDGPASDHLQAAACMKIGRDEALSGGKTARPMGPRLGNLAEWSGSWQVVAFNPMCQLGCYDDHVILFSFIPRGARSTDCRMAWLVRGDAVEGRDFSRDEITYMWHHTMAEDKTICANNQLGVASTAYRPGPYSTVESRAAETTEWYLRHFVNSPDQSNA